MAPRKKKFGVRASLTIFDDDLAYALREALAGKGWFTHVVHLPSGAAAGPWIGLLRLSGDDFMESSGSDPVTHLCLIEKQGRVATAQARLKVIAVLEIPNVSVEDIKRVINKKYRRWVDQSFSDSWAGIPAGTGAAIVDALVKLLPYQADEIRSFIGFHGEKKFRPGRRDETAAAEKDALALCLEVAGIDRDHFLRAVSINPHDRKSSFLGALKECRVYEDDLIMHDVNNVPGFEKLKAYITGAVEFQDDEGRRLTVINANRKPLEHAMGVDIIYYHQAYEAFTFVQYKMMDGKRADGQVFFDPKSGSTQKELVSMSALWSGFQKTNAGNNLVDYRMALCPFYFKLCKRLQLVAVDSSISPGAYLALDQFEILVADNCTKGPSGGRQIGYFNLDDRYLRTSDFVDLVCRGLVGTKQIDTKFIEKLVDRLIQQDHSVLYAIESEIKAHAA